MDDDVRGRQELGLIKAFLCITDARKRQIVLELAEQLTDAATSGAAGLDAHETSSAEERGDSPGRME